MSDQETGRFPEPPQPKPTGRTLVLFHPEADASKIKRTLKDKVGAKTTDSRDFSNSDRASYSTSQGGDSVYMDRFKICFIERGSKSEMKALADDESVLRVRPEFYMFAIADMEQRYASWVREGLQILADQVGSAVGPAGLTKGLVRSASLSGSPFADDDQVTWGLHATGAHQTQLKGKGIRVAVLDTGLDLEHPDFKGRSIVTKSFAAGEDVQDVQGHGTHTAGTVAGLLASRIGRRYGVAPEVDLHIGKVLNNGGSGTELDILDGINWAIDQNCVVISMSLGRPTFSQEKPDPVYERTGAAALQEGCLIIAAAGNESARDFNFIAPVASPANSPSIMAVAAVDPKLDVAPFSCGGLGPSGGEVDISGPGVSVYSAFPLPRASRLLQGTSMACPHVAGIAALWAESDPSLRGQRLWEALVRSARPLGSGSDSDRRDFGEGLVQAPGAGVSV